MSDIGIYCSSFNGRKNAIYTVIFTASLLEEERIEIKEMEDESDRKYKEGIAALDKEDIRVLKHNEDWAAECDKRYTDADETYKNNVKRRKELMMPKKPLFGN